MRYQYLGWLLVCGWLGVLPATAHADDLGDARKAMQKGDLRAAQIDLRNAVRSDPQNAEAHFWLGKVSLDLGDAVAAEREARAARERGFDPHQVVPLLAQAMLVQQRYKDLLSDLQPDGKDAVLDASILVARGYAQSGMGDNAAAQASFALAEKTAPNAVEPLLADANLLAKRGDLAGAQAMIDRAINAQPKSAEALLAKAEILRTKGDLKGSLAVLDQILTDQPGNIKALLGRVGLFIATNQPDKAKADLDAILKATPGNVQAIFLQAVLQAQTKDYKGADATLEKINSYLGRIPRGYFLQAIVKEQLGQSAQAEEAIRRYMARFPNDLAAYKVLARLEFAQHRPDLAADTLVKIVEFRQCRCRNLRLARSRLCRDRPRRRRSEGVPEGGGSGAKRCGSTDTPGERPHGHGRSRVCDGRSGTHFAIGANGATGWRSAVLRRIGNRRSRQGQGGDRQGSCRTGRYAGG